MRDTAGQSMVDSETASPGSQLVRRSAAPGHTSGAHPQPTQGVPDGATRPADDIAIPESVLRLSDYPMTSATPSASRFGLSIGQKLGLLILGLQLAIVTALGFHFDRAQSASLTQSLMAVSYTHLTLPTIYSV